MTYMITTTSETSIIPGLPQNAAEAVALIEETENSKFGEWHPIESVLDEIAHRYEVVAY